MRRCTASGLQGEAKEASNQASACGMFPAVAATLMSSLYVREFVETPLSGLEKRAFFSLKGVFPLEESLESLEELEESLESLEFFLCFPESGGSLESLNSLESLETTVLKRPLFPIPTLAVLDRAVA